MKKIFLLSTMLMVISFFSCKKEGAISFNNSEGAIATESQNGPVTRAYRDSFVTDLHFVPDIAAGWTYPNTAPAWYHGTAEGNATHMGNVNACFNTYGLRNSAGVVMVYNRPATMFYASLLQSYNVPSNVSAVVYDNKGNSIWFQIPSEGWTSDHPSLTRINYYGRTLIVGGTGKFEGATGETYLQGYFNPTNLQEGSVWRNGWIRY